MSEPKVRCRKAAENIKPGMLVKFGGRVTEVVSVVPPRSEHDGIQITTRYGLIRHGGGAHYGPHSKIKVFG